MNRQLLLATCASGVLLMAAPAWADAAKPVSGPVLPNDQAAAAGDQDQQQTDPNEPRKGKARVEERDIVITGARGAAIRKDQARVTTVITAEDRNLAGVNGTRDLLMTQPGFNYTDDFGINVRGVGRQTAQTLLGQENTVIQYVDGFINLVPSNIAESTLFGGNVSFVRGPAGTTYGRNAIGGAINVMSRAPTKEYTAQIAAGLGRGGAYNFGANISGPITDNLGFRVGAQEYETPSVSKAVGGVDGAGYASNNTYLEFQLEWRFRGFHIRNRATTFTYDSQPSYPSLSRYSNNLNGNVTPIFGGLSPNPAYGYNGPVPDQPYTTNVNIAGYDRLRGNFQDIVNADLDLGFAKLVYVGGYQTYIASGQADQDLTSRTSYDADTVAPGTFAAGTQVPTDYRTNYLNDNYFYSHELRLEGNSIKSLKWVAGLYYFNQNFDEQYWENIANATDVMLTPQLGADAATLAAPNPRRSTYEQRNLYKIRSTALFGNVTWDITDSIRFDGGLRYTWDEKDALTNFRYVYYYPPFYASDVSPAIHGAHTYRREGGLSGRAAIGWHDVGGNQIYASYARGYQSSAFTLGQGLPGTTGRDNVADKEFLDVWEVGGNYTLGKLRFDGSVFYQLFHNQQIPVSTLPAFGPVFAQFANARKTEIYGLEAQLSFRPNPQSNIVLSYTYLHAKFLDFSGVIDISEQCNLAPLVPGQQCTTAGGAGYVAPTNPLYQTPQDLSGNELSRTPQNKVSMYGYYGIDLGKAGHLYPGGTVYYQQGFYTSIFNKPTFRVPGRTVANLTLTYRTSNDRLDITGVVTNLFRSRYADSSQLSTFGSGTVQQTVTYGADRYWTLTARYRF